MASKAMRHLTTLSVLPLIDGVLLPFTALVYRCPQPVDWCVASIPRGVYGGLGIWIECIFVLDKVLHRCALVRILHRRQTRVMLLRDDL